MLAGLDPDGPTAAKRLTSRLKMAKVIIFLELSLMISFNSCFVVVVGGSAVMMTGDHSSDLSEHVDSNSEELSDGYSELELNTPDYSEFSFTSPGYNATIYENSVGKVYVESGEKMGMYINSETEDDIMSVKYKIVDGDPEQFFKAEAEQVGNFVFLLIRTRTSNINVLNRERTDAYALKIRATFRDSSKQRLRDIKASCWVNVQVLDTNDLDPFFSPTVYSVTVPEDKAVHAPILTVKAEDADSGINGEIYYNIAEPTDVFAIHPVTGVISLARSLVYSEKAKHRITVEARDRGMDYSYGGNPRRADTATVTINVEQEWILLK